MSLHPNRWSRTRLLLRVAFVALLLPLAAHAQSDAAKAKPTATEKAAAAVEKSINPSAVISTNLGDITVELFADKAPKSVENFIQYANDGFYNSTTFHRVIDNFMIQGGGFTQDLRQKPTRAAIQNEAKNGLSNSRGTLAMARTADPHSATAQFFINVVDNSNLDYVSDERPETWGYAVFGKVTGGMDVVDKIKSTPTGAQGPFRGDVPVTPVVIEKVTINQAPVPQPAE